MFKNGIAAVRLKETVRFKNGETVDLSGNKISSIEAASMLKEDFRVRWINTSGDKINDIKAFSILNVDRIAFEKKNIVKIR